MAVTLARLSLVEGGAHHPTTPASSLKYRHIDGPILLDIKHVASRVRLELAAASSASAPLLTSIITRLPSNAKLDPSAARFKAAGTRAALSFPADSHTQTSLIERFQCAFLNPQDIVECGKLLSPYFFDMSQIAPSSAYVSSTSAKPSSTAAAINPAQAAIAQAYSQSPASTTQTQTQLSSGRKGAGQKGGAKRKAEKDSMASPTKRSKKQSGNIVTAGDAVGTAQETPPGRNPSDSSSSGGTAINPTSSRQLGPAQPPQQQKTASGALTPDEDAATVASNDMMAAMKADLLRNFGQGPPAQSSPTLASSVQRPASPRTTSIVIEEDLLPRSPLIDASSQPDPAPFRRPSFHMQDLLSLDPVGFTPNEEISLINSAFPVMPTAVEEKEEAMRVRAEEAEFQEEGNGENSQSQISAELRHRQYTVSNMSAWRSYESMTDEELYRAMYEGHIPLETLSTAHRLLHLYHQLQASAAQAPSTGAYLLPAAHQSHQRSQQIQQTSSYHQPPYDSQLTISDPGFHSQYQSQQHPQATFSTQECQTSEQPQYPQVRYAVHPSSWQHLQEPDAPEAYRPRYLPSQAQYPQDLSVTLNQSGIVVDDGRCIADPYHDLSLAAESLELVDDMDD